MNKYYYVLFGLCASCHKSIPVPIDSQIKDINDAQSEIEQKDIQI